MFRKLKRKYWYPFSVSVEIALRKLRVRVDKFYRGNWVYVFIVLNLPYLSFAAYQINRDWKSYNNHANLDAPFAPIYTNWNTDGQNGKEPPVEKRF